MKESSRHAYHDGQVSDRTEEDTEGGPNLPGHDQSTAYASWDILCGEYRNSNLLETHTNAKEHTTSSKLTPFLGQAHAEGCQ
jgi:hypothetical protein